jgi:hypothetical protein
MGVIQVLQAKQLNSIIVVDPFESEKGQLPEARQKIQMHLSRYDHIKNQILVDTRYAKRDDTRSSDQIGLLSIGSLIGKSSTNQLHNVLGFLVQMDNQ